MTFAQLTRGDSVFVDANILVYHFQPHPQLGLACNQLMARIESQELAGFTATHLLTEAAHRLMMIEAATLPSWNPKKVKDQLLKQPAALQSLSQFQTAVDAVLQSRLQVLTVAPALVLAATSISRTSGLLSSDALTVAVMQASRLTNLASNDADFDRVPGLNRFVPV